MLMKMKDMLGMESGVARSERKKGISVPKESLGGAPLLFIGAELGKSVPFGIGTEKSKAQHEVYGGKFYVPHALSFALAALVSPVQFDNLIYGLAHPNVETSIEVLKKFGIRDAMVASTTHDDIHYLDEMGVSGDVKTLHPRELLPAIFHHELAIRYQFGGGYGTTFASGPMKKALSQ